MEILEVETEEQKNKKIEIEEKAKRDILLALVAKGELPAPSPLTRSQRKALDLTGFNISKSKTTDMMEYSELAEKMYDWIMDNVYPDFNFDSVANNICTAFALYVYKLTYEDIAAEKN